MSKVVTNSVVLGQSGTASNNFLLDTDAAGALRIRRNADGSGGSVLTVNSAGTLVQPAQSMVRLDTSNGYGSTNTQIRRFVNVRTNQGSDITYADSATLGGSFTINTAGVYAISYSDSFGVAGYFGISLSTTQPTIAIQSISTTDRACMGGTNGASQIASTGVTLYLAAGVVIRAHADSANGTTSAPDRCHFAIVRVA